VDSSDLLPLPNDYAIEPGLAPLAPRHDTVTVPVFWIVLLLSALVHVAVLFFLPPLQLAPKIADPGPLAVEIRRPALEAPVPVPKPAFVPPSAPRAPPPGPAIAAPKVAKPAPPPRKTIPKPAPAPSAQPEPPPVMTAPPVPEAATPPVPAEPPVPQRAEAPRGGDLSSYIEARRRARGEPAAPPPSSGAPSAPSDEAARRDQIVARNLGLGRTPEFGGTRQPGGGIFQITSLHYSNAEFLFFGWNKDIRRNTTQRIEVRKGEYGDIKQAVIQRMIAIIREHESGDFLWESERLGRDVVLSARPADNAGLEDFLWREFFGEPNRRLGAAGGGQG
jgi:outer membrane biosynthesis protein TonB